MPIALLNYTGKQLLPAYNPQDAIPISVNFAPNLTIRQGQLVGQITNATVNDVQTLTIVASGGVFTLGLLGLDGYSYTTAPLAFSIAAAELATALTALVESGGFHLATAGVTLQANVYTINWGGSMAGYPMPLLTATSALTGGTGQQAMQIFLAALPENPALFTERLQTEAANGNLLTFASGDTSTPTPARMTALKRYANLQA